jgi:hypothetical protein
MDETRSDDGCTVPEISFQPWTDIDWPRLFKRVSGSTRQPIQGSALAHFIKNTYQYELETAEVIPYNAYMAGELLRVYISFEGLDWEYYFIAPDELEDTDARVVIPARIFYTGDDNTAPDIVDHDELMARIYEENHQVRSIDVRRVIENLEYMEPIEIFDGKATISRPVAEMILASRSVDSISDAATPVCPAEEGPAYRRVLERIADYDREQREIR